MTVALVNSSFEYTKIYQERNKLSTHNAVTFFNKTELLYFTLIVIFKNRISQRKFPLAKNPSNVGSTKLGKILFESRLLIGTNVLLKCL